MTADAGPTGISEYAGKLANGPALMALNARTSRLPRCGGVDRQDGAVLPIFREDVAGPVEPTDDAAGERDSSDTDRRVRNQADSSSRKIGNSMVSSANCGPGSAVGAVTAGAPDAGRATLGG